MTFRTKLIKVLGVTYLIFFSPFDFRNLFNVYDAQNRIDQSFFLKFLTLEGLIPFRFCNFSNTISFGNSLNL